MSAQNSPKFLWSAVYALPLVFFSLFTVFFEKAKDSKLKGMLRLLNNNKKGG